MNTDRTYIIVVQFKLCATHFILDNYDNHAYEQAKSKEEKSTMKRKKWLKLVMNTNCPHQEHSSISPCPHASPTVVAAMCSCCWHSYPCVFTLIFSWTLHNSWYQYGHLPHSVVVKCRTIQYSYRCGTSIILYMVYTLNVYSAWQHECPKWYFE